MCPLYLPVLKSVADNKTGPWMLLGLTWGGCGAALDQQVSNEELLLTIEFRGRHKLHLARVFADQCTDLLRKVGNEPELCGIGVVSQAVLQALQVNVGVHCVPAEVNQEVS